MELEDGVQVLLLTRENANENIISTNGNYKISALDENLPYIDPYFYEDYQMSLVVAFFVILISTGAACLSAMPFGFYAGFLPNVEWEFVCILRSIAFGIIYFESWVQMLRDLHVYLADSNMELTSVYSKFPGIPFSKKILGGVFCILYSGLYAWKWYILDDLPAKYAAIIFFFISTCRVFYSLISLQISNSVKSSVNNRRRKILLSTIQLTEEVVCKEYSDIKCIVESLLSQNYSGFSLFVSVRADNIFYESNREELFNVYEEDFYDSFEYLRVSITNIFLGVAWMAMWLTMIEDYGHAVYITTKLEEEKYLWLISLVCLVLSGLYVLCSYNLCHACVKNIMAFLTLKNSCGLFKKFAIKIPVLFLGMLIASTRMNSSYATFGRLAAKYSLPYSIGFTLIYTGVLIVFLLDMITAMQLISKAIMSLIVLVGSYRWNNNLFCIQTFEYIENYFVFKYYIEKAKRLVREASDQDIENIIRDLPCRGNY